MEAIEGLLAYDLEQLPFVFLALVIAFTFHELAHAASAYWFGDDTAKLQGRVTFNPLVHLDWLGTLLVLIAGFGWAKPVPVNRSRFANPRLMGALVSFAGPLSNLLLCIAGLFVYMWLNTSGAIAGMSSGVADAVVTFLPIFIQLNMVLFLFNLLPLPPLDGFRIVEDLAPPSMEQTFRKFEPYGYVILLLMFLVPSVGRFVLGPLYTWGDGLLDTVGQFFLRVLS